MVYELLFTSANMNMKKEALGELHPVQLFGEKF